ATKLTAPTISSSYVFAAKSAISGGVLTALASSPAVTVNPGPATTVRVETAADGTGTVVPAQTRASGTALTGYAITRDALSNFVANVAATWSLASVTGGIVAGDLVPSNDAKSATFTGHVLGTAQLHGASNALTPTNSGTVTVVPGSAASVVYTPQPS